MTTPLYFDNFCLRFNSNLQALEYNSGNEVWLEVPVPSAAVGLSHGKIFVGNASNQAAGVSMSGGATISDTGVVTLAAAALTTLHTFAGVAGVATDTDALQVDVAHNSVGIHSTPDTAGNYALVMDKSLNISAGGITTSDRIYSGSDVLVHVGNFLTVNGSGDLNLKPSADGATGIKLRKADGLTDCLTIDTTNNQVRFWGSPKYPTSINAAATGTVTPASAYTATEYLYTVTGDLTINGPADGYDGQKITFRILNDASHSVTFATGAGNFRFGTTITSYTNSVSLTDYVGCIWNNAAGVWDLVSVSQGF